jgi:hypothetical protein
MATVPSQILKLIQRIDPRTKIGTEVLSTNIDTATTGWATVGGDRFTSQRVVDLYNDARRYVAMGIITAKGPFAASYDLGTIISASLVSFTAGAGAIPAGHVGSVSLIRTETGALIKILPSGFYDYTKHLDSAANPIVFEGAGTLVSPSGNTYIPDTTTGITYTLRYFNVTDWTVSQATAISGAATETFPERLLPMVISIAEMMANEQAGLDPSAVVKKLIGAQ